MHHVWRTMGNAILLRLTIVYCCSTSVYSIQYTRLGCMRTDICRGSHRQPFEIEYAFSPNNVNSADRNTSHLTHRQLSLVCASCVLHTRDVMRTTASTASLVCIIRFQASFEQPRQQHQQFSLWKAIWAYVGVKQSFSLARRPPHTIYPYNTVLCRLPRCMMLIIGIASSPCWYKVLRASICVALCACLVIRALHIIWYTYTWVCTDIGIILLCM